MTQDQLNKSVIRQRLDNINSNVNRLFQNDVLNDYQIHLLAEIKDDILRIENDVLSGRVA